MDEATRSRVGEMFFTTKGDFGHGIGLATSYEIVDRLGGRMELTSRLGEGTTFTMMLPRCEVEPLSLPLDVLSDQNAPVSSESAGGRILVIEDDDGIRDLVEVALTRYEVVSVPNGEVGLEAFFSAPFDLVLVDMSLPGKNGSQVADAIKSDQPDVPIVLMSGWTENIDLEVTPFHSVINKPFLTGELVSVIESALKG